MNDDLEHKTDDELNEIFATEIAGYAQITRTDDWMWGRRENSQNFDMLHHYCTDANAVLPWLGKCGNPIDKEFGWVPSPIITLDVIARSLSGLGWNIDLGEHNKRNRHASFARAAVVALIRAKRAQPAQ